MKRIRNREEENKEYNDEGKDHEQPPQSTINPLPSRKTEDEIPFDIIIE